MHFGWTSLPSASPQGSYCLVFSAWDNDQWPRFSPDSWYGFLWRSRSTWGPPTKLLALQLPLSVQSGRDSLSKIWPLPTWGPFAMKPTERSKGKQQSWWLDTPNFALREGKPSIPASHHRALYSWNPGMKMEIVWCMRRRYLIRA